MIFSFYYPAPANAIFGEGAATSLLGKSFTAKVEQEVVGEGQVIGACLADNSGQALILTVEWPEAGVFDA